MRFTASLPLLWVEKNEAWQGHSRSLHLHISANHPSMSWYALFSFYVTISVWVSMTCKVFFGYHGHLRQVFWPDQFFRARSNLKHSFILTALNSATMSVVEIPPRAMKSNCIVYIYYFVWPACFYCLLKCVIRFPWRMTTWAQGGLKLSKRRTLTGRRKLRSQSSISRSLL